ncbi:MAG: hypothetical protein IJT23_10930 [Clostridia bacterium]|nr:hypothetical protein [Clostridia bacterium]
MAEKYGVVPKKFTLAWFDYVWTYYKWHILIPLVILLFTLVTVYQCTHRTPYDIEVIYAGHTVFTDNQMKEIPLGMAKYCDDINGDDKTLVSFDQINFRDVPGSEELDYNLQMKLDLQFQRNKSFLFIFDKDEMDLMLAREHEDMIYYPVSEWAKDMPSDDKLYTKNGIAYGVSLADNEVIKSLGIKSQDLYLVVRINYSDEPDADKKYANAIKLANALVGNVVE